MSYEVKEGEKGMVHARLSYQDYDPTTGKPTVQPFVQKFTPQEFNQFEKNGKNLGYKIEILHDPRDKKPDFEKEQGMIELEKARKEYEGLFNKKPHNQKSAETLRKEIDEKHEYDSVLEQWQELMKVKTTPSMSKDEMIEDIRKMMAKEKTVQQESEEAKEAKEKEIEKSVKENAERQSN